MRPSWKRKRREKVGIEEEAVEEGSGVWKKKIVTRMEENRYRKGIGSEDGVLAAGNGEWRSCK